MANISIRAEKCKGCGLCINACPKKILEFDKKTVNGKGYNPVRSKDQAACIGCAFCAVMCPDIVIEVYKDASKSP